MSESNITEQERVHQLLCAYVLGEADAGERAEIEGLLEKDAALREERARLEATIGMVQGALGSEETLSYQATSDVTRAASLLAQPPAASRRAPWYGSSSFRAAASIVAVVGGAFLGWRVFVIGQADSRAPNTHVASVDREEELPKDGGDLVRLKGLGYGGSVGYGQLPPNMQASRLGLDPRDGAQPEASLAKKEQAPEAVFLRAPGSATGGLTVEDLKRFDEQRDQRAAGLDSGLTVAAKPEAVLLQDEAEVADSVFEGRGDNSVIGIGGGAGGLFGGRFNRDESTPPQPTTVGATTPGTPGPGAPAGASGSKAAAGSEAAAPGELSYEKKLAATGPATDSKERVIDPAFGAKPGGKAGAEEAKAVDPTTADKPSELAEAEQLYLPKAKVATDDKPAALTAEQALRDLDADEQGNRRFDNESDLERLDRMKSAEAKNDGFDNYFLGAREQRRILTPEERHARIEEVIVSCRPLPNERPRDMFFRFWGDNPFEWTTNDRQSTFSMDVDTASYTLARKYLVAKQLPEKAQIRTEEFVNYFAPDIAPPKQGTFAIATELAPSRFGNRPDAWMLRVGVRGMEVAVNERAPLALTFVIDVSGSMEEGARLELVKHALRMLLGKLDARDSISIVAFSSDTRLILPMTSAAKRDLIESAIHPLKPDGGTNTEAGLRMGYEQALGALTKNATNRVVLLTDGVANIGITDANVLVQTVERQRKAGIYLNTIGVGMNNHNDTLLEQLADKGDGVCNYVDDAAEVQHALVDNFLQALVPIARDAKVQVEFDPTQVESYRLLGYENRAIADHDFRNDKVDAGEINSGHQITALYEIVRTGRANSDAPLATVHVRFKPPHKDGVASPAGEEASEITKRVLAREAAGSFEATSPGYRRAVLAAQFAEFLRRSVHARGDSLDQLIADVRKLSSERADPQVVELGDMVVRSKLLLEAELVRHTHLQARVDELRLRCYERERLRALHRDSDRELLLKLDLEVAQLEQTLRQAMEERRVK